MSKPIIPAAQITRSIHFLPGQKVMLDLDLAALYDVPTGRPNRAVKRNRGRFPDDFMFWLTVKESEILKSQFGISSWVGHRGQPCAFTKQGVAMLSSVIDNERIGERMRLACWRWRPRHSGLGLRCRISDSNRVAKRFFSASRRKEHASRVRSPR